MDLHLVRMVAAGLAAVVLSAIVYRRTAKTGA